MLSEEPRSLFGPYVDDELDAAARHVLEEALSEDEALRRDFDDYKESIELLRGLPTERAPDRFLLMVQNRIRRRTRGRHFGYLKRPRTLVVEAAVCAVLIFIMAALYLFGAPQPTAPEHDGVVARVTLSPADARMLAEYGRIETVGTSIVGDDLVVTMNLPTSKEAALRDALRRHTRMDVVPTSRYESRGRVWLSVRARPGPVLPW